MLDESPLDVFLYYLEEMPGEGWELFAVAEPKDGKMNITMPENVDLNEFHPALFFMGGAGASTGVFFLIHPDTGRVYVMMTYN
jgi:hypothetical protein